MLMHPAQHSISGNGCRPRSAMAHVVLLSMPDINSKGWHRKCKALLGYMKKRAKTDKQLATSLFSARASSSQQRTPFRQAYIL